MRHEAPVLGAVFSDDDTRVLTWGADGSARLWNLSYDSDFPARHLKLLVEVASGTTIDSYGNLISLSREEWQEKKRQYIPIAEAHLRTCKYPEANLYRQQKAAWQGQ